MDPLAGIPRRRLLVVGAIELVAVLVLALTAWHLWQARTTPVASGAPGARSVAGATPEPTAASTPIPLPADGTVTPAAGAGGGTGQGESASTLLQHLQQFNGVVSSLEGTESAVLRILIPGTVWYLTYVVVPRVVAALHGGG